jgi:hypothetical protein
MNERSKKLAEQAEKYADDNFRGEPTWSEAFESKFAELMTTEFIGLLEYEIAMLEKYKTTSCNDSDRRWHEGKIVHFRRMIDKTKDHFGVE